MLTKMSRLELVGYLTATVHSIAGKVGSDYLISKNDGNESINIIVSSGNNAYFFHIYLNHEDLPQHIADVCAEINNIQPNQSNIHG